MGFFTISVSGATQPAILSAGFVNEGAPYPECHASTLAEPAPGKLVAAWFGGTKERNPDVGIWVAHFENGRWQPAIEVANGVQDNASRQPTRDGMLQALGRTRNGSIGVTWSHDGGLTWTPLIKSELPNPNSGTDAVTLADGRHLIVYNHSTTGSQRADKGDRWPLDVVVSADGLKWQRVLTLEAEPISSGYAYPAVIRTGDGRVHVSYTFGRAKIKHVVLDPEKLH